MKKRISGLFILILFLLTGCKHNYTAIPYNKFISTFDDKDKYKVINNTVLNQGIYEKSYEVGNGNISFYYLKFKTSKEAKDYMDLSYKNRNFHYKSKDNYIVAKRKISKIYIKAVKVDKIIVIGMSEKFFDRFEVNKIFKELGL